MSANRSNSGSLIAGAALIAFGLLALAGQIFRGVNFWGVIWPFLIIGVGVLFFVGMYSGGKSAAGLAIPGSIFTAIESETIAKRSERSAACCNNAFTSGRSSRFPKNAAKGRGR